MRGLSATLLVLILVTAALGCVSTPHPTATGHSESTATSSQAPGATGRLGGRVYGNWYHNSTKYFEIYYPKEIRDDPVLQSKLNMLLLGADSAYASYARLFGTRPQKAKIYLYPSEKALENITGRKEGSLVRGLQEEGNPRCPD